MNATRFPLCWPPGRPRTPASRRDRARFHTKQSSGIDNGVYRHPEKHRVTLTKARDLLFEELRRLGAAGGLLSSDLRLRQDGLPMAGQRQPDDPGAAVYFKHDGNEVAFACDRWDRVEDNILAIAKTIEALRGIERWGTGDMVAAAFTGFAALPAARVAHRAWWIVLDVPQDADIDTVQDRYRQLAKDNHPDRGGDEEVAAEINGAWAEFKQARGT